MSRIQSFYSSFAAYRDSRLITILLLGFVSGLPLALTASTLSAWLTEEKLSMTAIGLFAAVGMPYALKFLWSPLIDGAPFPFLTRRLGRRRGWILATQLGLMISILVLGAADPAQNLGWTALLALLVSICSASQDVAIDAYRVEILEKELYGHGAAMVTLGYRIGMLVSGAGALFLAEYFGWHVTYFIIAAIILIGVVTVLLTKEPEARNLESGIWNQNNEFQDSRFKILTSWFRNHVIAPFRDFAARPGWVALLLFIALYKLGDAFLGTMTNPFLLTIGFTKPQIASVVKIYGFAATIIGSFIGASLVQRFGMIKPLWVCGAAHALTNLMFLVQAKVGADINVLALGITLENLTGGMSAAVFVAFISSLCRVNYTATQYALLSSLAALGRTTLSSSAGWFVEKMGWEWFFVLCVALAFPSLMLLWWMQKQKMVKE